MKIKYLRKLKVKLIKIKYKIYLQNIYLFLIGITTSFSLPPYNYWFINFLTFSLLFIILHKNPQANLKHFFLFGYFFGFGYFLSNMYWIPLSLSYDNNFNYLIPVAIILIPAFLSFFYAFAFLIFKMFFNHQTIFINILSFSLILGFFEFLRGTILTGFPWNLFAYSFSENLNIIQITSLIGSYAFNTILITTFSAFSILVLYKNKKEIYALSIVVLIAASIYIYGTFKLNDFKNLKPVKLSYEVKVLSTKIPIERFYSNFDDEEILINLIKLSKPWENENSIFVWPEGILPNINLSKLTNEYNYLFEKSFKENHFVILGINDEIENGKNKIYNSLSIIDYKANLIHKYYKNKLVPFGEFLPLENILTKIGLRSITNNYQSYTASADRNIFEIEKYNFVFLPLICYEIIYSGKLSNNNNYSFIINISEDGWFGKSIGPYQHFSHSIFRSVEYGKYTLRSANNGISAIIDPSGSILQNIDTNNEGVISIKEIVNTDKTLFSIYGNKIYFLIILLYIFLIFSFKKIQNE